MNWYPMSWALLFVGMSAGLGTSVAAQQPAPSELSLEDSIGIFSSVIQTTLAELGTDSTERELRIWMPGRLVEGSASTPEGQYPVISESVRQALAEAFPGIRFIEDYRNMYSIVFQCPDGVKLRMPGSGCPIQDGGVVLMLGVITRGESGELWTHSSLTQSAPSRRSEETNSWAQGFRVSLARSEEGDWDVVNTTAPWIT